MIGFPNPQQQAWWQAVQQKNAAYQQQIDVALDQATLHQALSYPRQYGFGRMANPLLSPAQNTATPLFQSTNPEGANFQLMNYMMQAPGGNTIGLPGDDTLGGNPINSSNALLGQLLGRSGVG